MSERLGKKFAEDFEQIDDVKPTDKILIQDSEDRVVKYAIPQQVNSKFEKLVADIAVAEQSAQTATDKAQDAAHSAEVAQSAKSDAVRAMIDAQTAEAGAQQAVNDAVAGYASEVQELKQEAEDATQNANAKAQYAKEQGDYAKEQGDYAKAQGDYAKQKGTYAQAQGERAEQSANNADASVQRAGIIFERANNDHQTAVNDHATAVADNTRANTDHTRANADHKTAVSDHKTATADHAISVSQQEQFEQSQAQRASTFNASEQERTSIFNASQQSRTNTFNASEQARANTFNAKEAERDNAVAVVTQEKERLDAIYRDFGKYNNPVSVTLSKKTDGKFVNVNGTETTNSAYAISNEVSLNAGDILLVPSASAVLASCSVVAQIETNTYAKVILYAYTYDGDKVLTATADYDSSLVYNAVYDEDLLVGWVRGGVTYQQLPATHEVTESHYIPLVKQSVSSMPDSGYYIYLATDNINVVVSAFKATIDGGVVLRVGWGIFKNIANNFVGADKQEVIACAICTLYEMIRSVADKLENGVDKLSVNNLVINRRFSSFASGGNVTLIGTATPAIIPDFIGQHYIDKQNKVAYIACGNTAVSDWRQITNA